MKIYLVRHAETDYDLTKKDCGEYPGPSLTKNGLKQAEEIAMILSNIKFDQIYCSDLQRTKQTAEPLNNITKQKINFDSRIRETSDIMNGYLHYNDMNESETDQKDRLKSFISDISQKYDSILIVSHFNTIEFLSRELGGNIKKPAYASINCIEI